MIYSGTIEAKTGHLIPTYKSGKPAHSKYNPTGERLSIAEDFFGCIIVFGIAGGFHIKNLLANENIFKVIAVESDNESLDFCLSLETVKELSKNERVALCTMENFCQCTKENYIPSLHKKLSTLFLRSWHDELPDADARVNELLNKCLDSISADISVQAHFGKHWHINILSNLKHMSQSGFINTPVKIPEGKTKAAIIAAGPTLDNSIEQLKWEKECTYIVSTDTAYGTLLNYHIVPDAVVSVDAQQVSSEHFLGITKCRTVFIFDISSNPETVRTVSEKGNKIFFIRSNHPLANLIADKAAIPYIESGSGTVTIAAADWARQQKFRQIEFFGADFAYSDGKPYCRGTYLEKKFYSSSSRISSSEEKYSTLMFRTDLEKTEKGLLGKLGKSAFTNKILASYGSTLLQWASKHNLKQNGSVFTAISSPINSNTPTPSAFDFKAFISSYIEKVQSLADRMDEISLSHTVKEILGSRELISLLPLFAASGKETITEDISLALQLLLYYNL